ncbi:hypothetical protein SAMN05660772_01857 [Pasteurella testudinis DSM 23072]|uniref:Uncharacterized protein n=1 Tax=Pasteurella testudinis DSM 23072 TaxID=1122938 RepID=A0A1W1UL36_9PAST|nr:hypothetical protein [Pasteurella testudinis]SMB81454.1 hypothetical protein SAMN05660772_01857 [Pasteurella testudinis DSM 23072]SUB51415.1 Uncharacterised protein [Pasteurella testudinis]
MTTDTTTLTNPADIDGTITDVLNELDAGVFTNKMTQALKQVALGVVTHNKQGKLTVEFVIKKADNDSDQVQISHKLKYDMPTKRGKLLEEDTTVTPMYVGRGGKLSVLPLTLRGN